MTKKNRNIILGICIIIFFFIAPYIVFYSLGYRIDFEQKKLVATGGIYVKALPQGANVIIDSKISNKTSLLSPTVFVQNLLPKQHLVEIKKEGYYDYKKTLDVREKEVIKLERVILFKKNILFETLPNQNNSPFIKKDDPPLFIIKNDNLYKNDSKGTVAILKKIVSFEVSGNNIIWLGSDGFLYRSSQDGKTTDKLSNTPLKINKGNLYEFSIISQFIFLKVNNSLSLFNQKKGTFETFYSPVNELKISPDGQKILYYNDSEILYSYLNTDNSENIFLNRFSEKIGDVFWINNDYLIFNLGEKIVISELDNRDTINTVAFPTELTLSDGRSIALSNFKISMNQNDKKLYILIKNILLASEKLIP